MKVKRLPCSVLFLGLLFGIGISSPSFASNGGEPKIPTAVELNRLSRDLIPTHSTDFFYSGRQRLEGLIQQLHQEPFPPEKPVLKILPMPQLDDSLPFLSSPRESNQ